VQVPREKRVDFKKIIGTIIPNFSLIDAWRGGWIVLYRRLVSQV
jgi:hypothetical protein